MLLSEFSQSEKIIPCPRAIICNNCEQNIMLGAVLNSDDNVDYQEDYGFRVSFFKLSRAVIDGYTKKKSLKMQLEKFRPQRNIEKNDKESDERYRINMIDDKEYDEKYQIGKNKEE